MHALHNILIDNIRDPNTHTHINIYRFYCITNHHHFASLVNDDFYEQLPHSSKLHQTKHTDTHTHILSSINHNK